MKYPWLVAFATFALGCGAVLALAVNAQDSSIIVKGSNYPAATATGPTFYCNPKPTAAPPIPCWPTSVTGTGLAAMPPNTILGNLTAAQAVPKPIVIPVPCDTASGNALGVNAAGVPNCGSSTGAKPVFGSTCPKGSTVFDGSTLYFCTGTWSASLHPATTAW